MGKMTLQFRGRIWYWRGPAPFYFVTIPESESSEIKEISALVTYGWGVIPVSARIGETKFSTSLFPKDGSYLLPVRLDVREAENLKEGYTTSVQLEIKI